VIATLVPAAEAQDAVPLVPLRKDGLAAFLAGQPAAARAWVEALGFTAEPGTVCLVPAADGRPGLALLGIDGEGDPAAGIWDWAAAAERLASGAYRIRLPDGGEPEAEAADRAALGWALAAYRYDRFRREDDGGRRPLARLVWPAACDRAAVERAAAATFLVRDLVNAPASHLGPAELAAAAGELAGRFGAACRVIVGEELEAAGFPAVRAVGRASARAPRLIDLAWGREGAPEVALVGKGVCFDSGGLDLKSSANMKLMKKDMGGAAHVLALAQMVMAAGLPVRLRILVPAVENAVGGDALRPLDVVPIRKGTTVEIGNTDAEGRVVLADALWEASRGRPALLIDCATLTGAARAALGPDVPALFSNDDGLAAELLASAAATGDPLWRLPLWKPYRKQVLGKTAELTNDPESPHSGAITAALFLAEFVAAGVPWLHLDMMAWNAAARPGRPEGGEAQGLRALFALLARRFGG
jgi:leucyl aminopeptidase